MSPDPNSPLNSSDAPDSAPRPTNTPSASGVFRANQAANERHVGPTTDAPVIESYKPSGRIGTLGLPLLLVCLIVVPIVAAILYDKLGHFGGLVLISQIILGVLVGGAVFGAVHLGKVRSVALASTVGALVGLATFGLAMGLEAWSYRPLMVRSVATSATRSGINSQQAQAVAESYLTPLKTTQIYWGRRAEFGVSLTSSGRGGSSTFNVSGPLFWGLEGLELFFVVAIGILFGSFAAKRRFSEEFDRWYITKTAYSVHPPYVPALLQAAQDGQWEKCRQIALQPQPGAQPQVGGNIVCAYIPEKPGGIVTINAIPDTRKGFQPVFERELNNEEMKTLWPDFPMPNTAAQPFSS